MQISTPKYQDAATAGSSAQPGGLAAVQDLASRVTQTFSDNRNAYAQPAPSSTATTSLASGTGGMTANPLSSYQQPDLASGSQQPVQASTGPSAIADTESLATYTGVDSTVANAPPA